MSNLFSIFDPSSFILIKLNWVSALIVLLLIPCTFWVTNWAGLFFKNLTNYVNGEFAAILGPTSSPGLTFIPTALFLFIVLNNFSGLLPYIFTATRHLTLALSLALPLWLGHIIIGWLKTSQHILAHLVPLGTPVALMPFMVLIELTRSLIRPITLSVRLAANIIAGHLLLCLLRGQGPTNSYLVLSILLTALILLALLETAVSVIQAYVFSVLRTLYFNEVNSPSLSS